LTFDRPDGLTKLIIDPETERILGVGIVGAGAGELIGRGRLAVETGLTAKDMALSSPHIRRCRDPHGSRGSFYGHPTHTFVKKKAPAARLKFASDRDVCPAKSMARYVTTTIQSDSSGRSCFNASITALAEGGLDQRPLPGQILNWTRTNSRVSGFAGCTLRKLRFTQHIA